MAIKKISVVVPVFNEAGSLQTLYDRLSKVLCSLRFDFEIVFVDDGSQDKSPAMLKALASQDTHVKAIILARNFGQHSAVCAGFEMAQGDVVVTLDADLQNPPEEIPKLVAKIEEGFDVVGGIRQTRKDPVARRLISFVTNHMASVVVGRTMRDCGCMLRAYRKDVIDEMLQLNHAAVFIPALTASLANRFTEIPVAHDMRFEGKSKYNLFRFLLIYFDLITGYSAIPIQIVSIAGFVTAGAGFLFGLFLLVRRLVIGPDVSQGVFTLMAILFLFMGLLLLVLGLIGEYISRIYLEVRGRRRTRIREIFCSKE
ncbi:MAG: glycosyltransferase [Desulfobacteraceae bacterium]|nr:MAG: glycosyltransferase [Desulfobacteraceae bacterium]